jgi:NDP-sugar pyrophosphorylase family protein
LTPIVIFAGGRGLRLHPLTDKLPKPLLKVGSHPILEQIIDGFSSQGFRRFWLCVNYRADLIEDYFGDGSSRGLKIKYIEEDEPLGTGGALNLLPDFDVPYIVCNADVLTKLSYGHLMEAHARSNAQATVCAALYQHQVPYGVLRHENGSLDSIDEKPIENFSVNAGIYVLEPGARDYAPSRVFDMPDLIGRLKAQGLKVSVHPLEDFWCDVGTFEDLARANQGLHL